MAQNYEQPNRLAGAEGKKEPRAFSYINKNDVDATMENISAVRDWGRISVKVAGRVEPVRKRVIDEEEQKRIEQQKKQEADQRRRSALNKALPTEIWSLIKGYASREAGMKTLVFFDFDPVGTINPFMESNNRDVYMIDTSRYSSVIEIGNGQFPIFPVKRCQEQQLDQTTYLRPQHARDDERKSNIVTAQMLVTKIGTNAFLTYQMHSCWHIAVFHFESDKSAMTGQERCKFVATTFLHERFNSPRPALNPLPLGFGAPHFNRRIAAIVQLKNNDLLALGPIIEERYGESYDINNGVPVFPAKEDDPDFYQSFADRLSFDEDVIITSRRWEKLATGNPLNPNRMAFKAVQLNDNRVLIMAGYTSRVVQEMHGEYVFNVAKTTNTCEYLDLDLLQFSNGPSLPEDGNGLSLILVDEDLDDVIDDPVELLYRMPLNAIYQRELMFDAIKLSNGNILFSGAGAMQEKVCLLEFYKDGVYDPNPQWTVLEHVHLETLIDSDMWCVSLVELNAEYVAIVYKTRAISNLLQETPLPEANYALLLNMKTRRVEEGKVLCWQSSDGFYGVGAI